MSKQSKSKIESGTLLQNLRRFRIYLISCSCLLPLKRLQISVFGKPDYTNTKTMSSCAQNLIIIVGVIGNILSVVGVVICNKYITEIDGYDFMIFLSFLHFSFTMFGTRVMLMMGYFEEKAAPLSGILPVAIGSLMSVAFMNLNLSHNSVGFYQLSKLACIPFTLFVQFVAYKQTISTKVMLSLLPITFGVGYATVYDLELNLVGSGKCMRDKVSLVYYC